MGKLDGKVAIVTGASRGLGEETAKLFAAEGAKVVCSARTLKEGDHFLKGSLQSTVEEIKKAGGTAIAVPGNIADEASCVQLVEAARKAYGPIDVLVNNAVIMFGLPFMEYPLKRWKIGFDVNVHGLMYLCQLVLPDMIKRKSGSIVNLSSFSAVGPGRGPWKDTAGGGDLMYGATKAAVERFTQGLAKEVYKYGISVTCVSPSQGVVTAGTIFQKLRKAGDPTAEPLDYVPKSVLLLATEPLDKVTGRVTYSQEILKEFGWIKKAKGGYGVDVKGSGYSQI